MYQGESSSGSGSKNVGSTASCPPESQFDQGRDRETQGYEAGGGATVGGQFESAKQQLSSKAGELVERTREGVQAMADRAREEAGAVWNRMKDQGENVLCQGKDRTAEGVSHFASAIRETADRLHQEGDHNIAGYAEDVGGHLDRAARYLRENDLRALANDLGNTVRRRPGLVFAGLFIGGLVAARFLKASRGARQREEGSSGRGEDWTGSQWENEGGAAPSGGYGASGQGQSGSTTGFQGQRDLPGLPDDAANMTGQPGISPGSPLNLPDTDDMSDSGEPAGQPGYRPQPGF